MKPQEGVMQVDGWASHCRCGWRGPVRDAPLKAEEDGAEHECPRLLDSDDRQRLRGIAGELEELAFSTDAKATDSMQLDARLLRAIASQPPASTEGSK